MQEGEEAVPGRTQSRSGKGERCSGGEERCLAWEQGRCLFLKERVADLKAIVRSTIGKGRSEQILADLVLYVADLEV